MKMMKPSPVDQSVLFPRKSLSECSSYPLFPPPSSSTGGAKAAPGDQRRGDEDIPSAQYDASISFCAEAQACMARAEEAKLVDPRSCRDWFIRAARCFTLAAQSVSDEEIRVSLALLARSMVVNAMTFGHRSSASATATTNTTNTATTSGKAPGGATFTPKDTSNRGSSSGTPTATTITTPTAATTAPGAPMPPEVPLTQHRVRTAGISSDRVSGISQIPRSVHPAQALLQLEEELARLGIMEQGLTVSHRPTAVAEATTMRVEAETEAGGATNTIADSYLFLSSLQPQPQQQSGERPAGPEGLRREPGSEAASTASTSSGMPRPPSSISSQGHSKAPTPLTAVSAAATRVASAAAEAMPSAISGLAAPASEWISGWIHKRSPDPVSSTYPMERDGGSSKEVTITEGHRVSSDLNDYTVIDNDQAAAGGGRGAAAGAEVTGLDPSQSVHLVYSKDGAPPPPPLLASARSRDRVIAEQNLIRMSQTIQRLADENASLARRVEELQGLGAHCNKVRAEMRLFKQEYEGRFAEFKEYLRQHKGDAKLPVVDATAPISSVSPADAPPSSKPTEPRHQDSSSVTATEEPVPVGPSDAAKAAEIDRLQKIIVALLNDMKKTKSKLSKQEKVLAKHNLLAEVERSDGRGGQSQETATQVPAGRSAVPPASKPPLGHTRQHAVSTSTADASASAPGATAVATSAESRGEEAPAASPPPSLPSAPPPLPSLQRGRSIDAAITISSGMVGTAFSARNAPPLSPAATTMRDSLQRQLKSHHYQQQHSMPQQRPGTPNKGKEG